jgi:hypothetical protein
VRKPPARGDEAPSPDIPGAGNVVNKLPATAVDSEVPSAANRREGGDSAGATLFTGNIKSHTASS